MWHMSYGIRPHINEGLNFFYRVVVLVNEAYKTRDCGIHNEGLWSPNIRNSLYFKMKDWLVTKGSKIYCSIVNNFLRQFIIYCYTRVLSMEKRVIEIVLFIKLFYISQNNYQFFSVIDAICNLNRSQFLIIS
jgi:hypothetical protein